ncbi:hypothetical protein EON64_15700, partial [archaeon]
MSSSHSNGGSEQDLYDQSFRRGLKAGKLVYLDNLKRKALQDYELHGEASSLEKAFTQMKLYIGTSSSKLTSVNLADFRRFGLSRDVVERIGYVAYANDASASASASITTATGTSTREGGSGTAMLSSSSSRTSTTHTSAPHTS